MSSSQLSWILIQGSHQHESQDFIFKSSRLLQAFEEWASWALLFLFAMIQYGTYLYSSNPRLHHGNWNESICNYFFK